MKSGVDSLGIRFDLGDLILLKILSYAFLMYKMFVYLINTGVRMKPVNLIHL